MSRYMKEEEAFSTCSIVGCCVLLYRPLVSTCSGTMFNLLRTCRAKRLCAFPRCLWTIVPSSVQKGKKDLLQNPNPKNILNIVIKRFHHIPYSLSSCYIIITSYRFLYNKTSCLTRRKEITQPCSNEP